MKNTDAMKNRKTPVVQSTAFQLVCYVIGILLYILTFFAKNDSSIMALGIGSVFFAGYLVIYEGIEDTITQTIKHQRFHPNVHLLMTLGALGAILISEYREAALLILIFAGADLLEELAEEQSSREISNLLNLNPTHARRLNNDYSTEMVDVKDLRVGDRVQVLNGDQIATDGVVISGRSTIDQSAITGESIPIEVETGSLVFGSTLNGMGSFIFEVTKDSSETVFAKIVELVAQAHGNVSK